MVNQSKAKDPRFWAKWRDSGAVGTIDMTYEEPESLDKPDEIQINLIQKLKEYKLDKRVAFDNSALDKMRKLSAGNWRVAELYAGLAVLDALQSQRKTVSAKDIRKTNVFEAILLIKGNKDPWDDVRYIGTQVPTMRPEGVKLRRMLSLWDANRAEDTMNASRDGRLPQYALTDRIQYEDKEHFGPEVKIPFKYDPSREEVEAVAASLAKFISQKTGVPQEVRDISRDNSSFGAQYFVQNAAQAGEDPVLISPSYRVSKGFAILEEAQGVVSVNQEILCKHHKTTLEAYAQSVRSPAK